MRRQPLVQRSLLGVTTQSEATRLAEAGMQAFKAGHYESAVEHFRAAAQDYSARDDHAHAAELNNNLSVALLKLGRAQAALEAAAGTDQVFAAVRDARRQGMAINNQAAALESLRRLDEALEGYERAARILGEAGEWDLRAIAQKAAAAIQLRRGRITDAGITMIGSLGSGQNPSLFERVLKFLLRVIQR
jgi:tetratricopeptide (TPR) repeat protein